MVSSMAAATATKHPDRKVLVLDLSMHGSASYQIYGGTQAPVEDRIAFPEHPHGTHFLSRGEQLVDQLQPEKTARGLIQAALASSGGDDISIMDHCVNVAAEFPKGKSPSNLYLCAGGYKLSKLDFTALADDNVKHVANTLRSCFTSEWVVLVDTDAELHERPASLCGLACADLVCIIASPVYDDWLRNFTDPINALLFGTDPSSGKFKKTCALATIYGMGLQPKIHAILFNSVQKAGNTDLENIGFSVPADTATQIKSITQHAFEQTVNRNPNKKFFADVVEENEFSKRYLCAVYNIKQSVLLKAKEEGVASPMQDPELCNHMHRTHLTDLSSTMRNLNLSP